MKLAEGFTKKYNVDKLAYFEIFDNVEGAISREKQIKSWKRITKIDLITGSNPKWLDLFSQL